MTLKQKMWLIAVAVSFSVLFILGATCDVTSVVTSDDGGGTQTDGSDSVDGDGAGTGDGGGSTSEEANPNSPCTDQTNIYVTYVNESSARIGFVENFEDEANHSLSSSSLILQAAGDQDATRDKCITCPWRAGIRNIRYIEDGETTTVPFPDDLYRGEFSCGDNITYVFKDNASVDTLVETP